MIKIFFANSNTITSWIIRLFTFSKYSHVGFINEDTNTVLDSDGNTGVSEYPVGLLYKNYSKVYIFPLVIPYKSYYRALFEIGKDYDYLGVIGLPFNRDWQEDDKWFCSELVAYVLQGFITIKDQHRVTPNNLLKLLQIKLEGKYDANI